jgi:hypothetical protein
MALPSGLKRNTPLPTLPKERPEAPTTLVESLPL